jgi:glutathione S-transferase
MKGEHYSEWYTKLNPSRQVPTLEDDGFILTESSAILKYLAAKTESPTYPKDLKKRAHIDEVMDWFNTGFYRDFGYGVAYPQLFPTHKRPTDEIHEGVISWGKDKAAMWFGILDSHWLGGGKPYVCGNEITIADYLGACFVTIGEVLRCDYSHLPNVTRWINNMKKLSSWAKVNEAHYGFAGMVKDKQFKAITP